MELMPDSTKARPDIQVILAQQNFFQFFFRLRQQITISCQISYPQTSLFKMTGWLAGWQAGRKTDWLTGGHYIANVPNFISHSVKCFTFAQKTQWFSMIWWHWLFLWRLLIINQLIINKSKCSASRKRLTVDYWNSFKIIIVRSHS